MIAGAGKRADPKAGAVARELALFSGDGEMARRLRAFDWRNHPLGDPAGWPLELRAAVGIGMHSSVPTAIYLGRELRPVYNDAWSPVLAERHPDAIGRPAREIWADIWRVVGPQFEQALETGRGVSAYDQMLPMLRGGVIEETYWNYSLTPIVASDGEVSGVFNQGNETTERVMTTRSQAFLLELGDRLRDLTDGDFNASSVLAVALGALGRHLGLSRAGYAVVDELGRACTVAGSWRDARGTELSSGPHLLADFGEPLIVDMMAGRVASSDDVASDPRHSPQVARNFAAFGVRANLVAPVVRAGRSIAFLFLNDDRPRRWTRHHADLAREVADRLWSALDRAEATRRLRRSESRFAAIFEQSAVGLSEVDQRGRFLRFNESMARILGRSPDEAPSLSVEDVTHPDDMPATQASIVESADRNEPFTLEKRYVRPDGEPVWVVTHVTRLTDEAGAPSGFFSVTTDVTERKEQERIRAWLLAELNHRVKNNLSTVQALAHHSRMSTSSAEEFEATFNARLMALSRAHDLLTRETWTSAPLSDVVNGTLAPFALDDDRRIVIGGPEVRLSPTAAVTMTLAFHELATNAAKFGALSRPEGRVAVEWLVDTERNGGAVDLCWRESCGPVVAPPVRRGFGSRLIERGAPRELGGVARLDFQPGGLACAFHLPLSQKVMVP